MPLTCVPAGQGLVRRVWQVQDSNLRRHTPTDLQSESPNLLTSALVRCGAISARIPRDFPDTAIVSRTIWTSSRTSSLWLTD
jgi:hypothetical protein